MSIFDVEHQPRAHRILQRALSSRRMPHAYLFIGPDGVGRERLAVHLARVLLCAAPARSPLPDAVGHVTPGRQGLDFCGQCRDCHLVEVGTHPDLFLIYRQLSRQHPDLRVRKLNALELTVDIVRHFVIARAGARPACGRAKVFIVREAERLNTNAQNCLLKTLEEPPADTFIILLTSAADRMLPTTRSRCQQVVFQSLPTDYVLEQLRRLRPDADPLELAYVARHAAGSLGKAILQIDDGLYPLKCKWGEMIQQLMNAPSGRDSHALTRPFTEDAKKLGDCLLARDPDVSDTEAIRAGVRQLLAVLADFYLDALRQQMGVGLPPINVDQPAVPAAATAAHSPAGIISALKLLAAADTNLARNAHLELTLETLFIRLAGTARRHVLRSPAAARPAPVR